MEKHLFHQGRVVLKNSGAKLVLARLVRKLQLLPHQGQLVTSSSVACMGIYAEEHWNDLVQRGLQRQTLGFTLLLLSICTVRMLRGQSY